MALDIDGDEAFASRASILTFISFELNLDGQPQRRLRQTAHEELVKIKLVIFCGYQN